MQLRHIEDESLVARCTACSTDKRVLNELIERYGRLIMQTITWTFQRYSAAEKEEAEDVFQEVFISLFENDAVKLKAYDPCKAGLGTYLMTIAKSAALNALNKRKRGRIGLSEDLLDETTDALSAVENADLLERMRILLNEFTANERLFYHLYFEECMPPDAVAKVMGVSMETVYSKKSKIVEKIRKGMRNVIKRG